MPALGKAKANPGFRPSANPLDDFDDDDDTPVLDDATRRLIVQELHRDRMPPVYQALPRGAGSQGANFLNNQQARSVATSTAIGGGMASLNAQHRRAPAPSPSSLPTPPQSLSSAGKQMQNRPLPPSTAVAAKATAKVDGDDASDGARQDKRQPFLDPELVEVMASRLRFLERQVSFLQSEVREKSVKLSDTQNRLAEAEDAVGKLQSERFYLAEKVASMNQFLADYGMRWVGDGGAAAVEREASRDAEDDGDAAPAPAARPFDLYAGHLSGKQVLETADKAADTSNSDSPSADSSASRSRGSSHIKGGYNLTATTPRKRGSPTKAHAVAGAAPEQQQQQQQQPPKVQFDFDRFVANCEALSGKVSQHEMVRDNRGGTTGGTMTLRHRDVVRVVVFADGITVHGGPFRPFGWALCDAFVQDVLDGFFPYEYRTRYPDGFPIEVIDKRAQTFLVQPQQAEQPGSGGAPFALGRRAVPGQQQSSKAASQIRGLHDSPYSLRAGAAASGGASSRPAHGQSGSSSGYNGGRTLGGTRHAGAAVGQEATRELILKRMPTRYVTPSGRIINPAAGLQAFLGLADSSGSGGADGGLPRPRTPPRMSKIRPRNEEHRRELEAEEAQAQRAAAASQQQMERAATLMGERAASAAMARAESDAGGDGGSMMGRPAFSARAVSSEGGADSERHVRVIFPSGEDCVVCVPSDATVRQLHDAIRNVAPPHLVRPPVDVNDIPSRGGGAAAAASSSSAAAHGAQMLLRARVPPRALLQEDVPLAAAGVGVADTVVVSWSRM